ncbi:ShET2/EspL2 family type III secretion system effector toxin [Ralstonia solanacearum]|nr:ShET2/EspL2 family type III secretion system effector toxin [Ralstonia solanacearum]
MWRVYDPNRTLTHKRVRVTDLQSLERLTFHDFLDTGVDYGRPSVLGVISPSLSLEHDPESTWTGDATLKGRSIWRCKRTCHGSSGPLPGNCASRPRGRT